MPHILLSAPCRRHASVRLRVTPLSQTSTEWPYFLLQPEHRRSTCTVPCAHRLGLHQPKIPGSPSHIGAPTGSWYHYRECSKRTVRWRRVAWDDGQVAYTIVHAVPWPEGRLALAVRVLLVTYRPSSPMLWRSLIKCCLHDCRSVCYRSRMPCWHAAGTRLDGYLKCL